MEDYSLSKSGGKLVGAAAKGYEIISSWEESAPLDSEQLSLIDSISKQCAERPIPEHLSSCLVSELPSSTAIEDLPRPEGHPPEDVLEMEGVVLQTTQQFYKWYAKLEALRVSEAEEKYKECANQLRDQLKICKDAKSLILTTLKALDDILELHKDAVGRSKSLRDTGERLVEEQDQLSEFAIAVRSRLQHFEELESIAAEFHSIASSMDSKNTQHQNTVFERFLNLLKRVDSCISYMSTNPQFAEAAPYEARFRQLHSRAIAGILHKHNEVLKSAIQVLEPEISAKQLTEGEETNLFHVKFLALVEEQLKSVLQEVTERSTKPEYKKLLKDCQQSFCRSRVHLLLEVVKNRILKLQQGPLEDLLREGFAYLLQICRSEHKLLFLFFPEKETLQGLVDLMESVGTVLYDVVRPKLITVYSIDSLCEYVSILKNEIYNSQIESLGDSVDALRTVVVRTLADAQERLIYRAQTFIQEKIVRHEPQQSDFNFPELLRKAEKPDINVLEGEDTWKDSQTWYPTVRMTLEYIEKLYECLEAKIFGGMAHEAVLACSLSIVKAVPGVTKVSGDMDGQLFAIRHLLLLREKLVPFKIEYSVTEKDLDFTHMRDHMRRVLSGEVSVFQLPTNSVVQLMTWTAPRVTDNQVDSKKQLEKQLKDSCESLIMMITKSVVEPILAFLTKVPSKSTSHEATSSVLGSGVDVSKPLYEHAFASEERLVEIMDQVNENLETVLPELVPKVKAYLPQAGTFNTLFKPIRTNIVDAHLQLMAILHSEYKGRDLSRVKLKTKDQLKSYLEAL